MSDALLSLREVTLERGGRRLFEGLNLAVRSGEAVHVAGPNGCGKSSLIRLAAGLLQPSRGDVRAVQLAMCDDKLALDRELPLTRALHFWADANGRAAQVSNALEQFGLGHLAEVPVRLLSTGQAKRAGLARVALSAARLWLLDEPLNGLDRQGAECLSRAIAAHRMAGGCVLAASHVALAGDWVTLELGR